MSFSFGFSPQDLDNDAIDHSVSGTVPPPLSAASPLDVPPLQKPAVHSVLHMLHSLTNVKITFESVRTATTCIYRRPLYDVKHQLMCDDRCAAARTLLLDNHASDLQANVYEGGFKSWDGSYDLVDHLAARPPPACATVLDLGCGTALPLCALFSHHLRRNERNVHYILSDYNYDVLRLVTVPNMLVHWAKSLVPKEHAALFAGVQGLEDDQLLITLTVIDAFMDALHARGCAITLISGLWGRDFTGLVQSLAPSVDYLISCETIYCRATLAVVAHTVHVLAPAVALIAAKDIYFGVGGLVHEFLQCVNLLGDYHVDTQRVGQLTRLILTITRK